MSGSAADQQKIQQLLQGSQSAFETHSQKLEQIVQDKLDQCYDQSRSDVNKFLDCSLKFNKLSIQQQKRISFGLPYLSRQAVECIQKGDNVEQCQNAFKSQLDSLFSQALQKLK